jgi:hypothetical protein
MQFYLLNWVQLSCDFGKVVPSRTTQGKACQQGCSFFNKLHVLCKYNVKQIWVDKP